jgi:hypothetical protein
MNAWQPTTICRSHRPDFNRNTQSPRWWRSTAASEKMLKASKRRRPAEERIRQELEKKAPEYINSCCGQTCWYIASILVETGGTARSLGIDAKSKALTRYYARLKDHSQD